MLYIQRISSLALNCRFKTITVVLGLVAVCKARVETVEEIEVCIRALYQLYYL